MEQIIRKYAQKIENAGLAAPGDPLIGGLDAELVWNREDDRSTDLQQIFDALSINSLLFTNPAEPYRTIINYLAANSNGVIYPKDCETRTFLHDLPVIDAWDMDQVVAILKKRKTVIIQNHGVITFGTVSPEQSFVSYSSVCFACFVKFFSDYLTHAKSGSIGHEEQIVFKRVVPLLTSLRKNAPELQTGPFSEEAEVYRALSEAGQKTVEYDLVDSYFGNISSRLGDILYISQTSSSLDELDGFIDPVPMDGSSCTSVTSSSELTAHKEIYCSTVNEMILHGHPKFSVILSMDCDKTACELEGECHINCRESRFIQDIPIVPGEVGNGPKGLCKTMPPAIKNRRGVIVYGHGVFTACRVDFNEAFSNLLDIERMCFDDYFKRLNELQSP